MKFNARAWLVRLLTAAIAVVAVVAVSAQPDQRRSPLPAYYFEVEISGTVYPFKSCSGLKVESEVIEYQEGGSTGNTRKLIGVTRWPNLRLTRAFTGDRLLYDWYKATKKPNPGRINGHIRMFDNRGTEIAAWKFVNGFIAKWEGPELDATKNEIAIESIEIAHEGLVLLPDDDDDDDKEQ